MNVLVIDFAVVGAKAIGEAPDDNFDHRSFERATRGRHLLHDRVAIRAGFKHPLNAPDLAFHPA